MKGALRICRSYDNFKLFHRCFFAFANFFIRIREIPDKESNTPAIY